MWPEAKRLLVLPEAGRCNKGYSLKQWFPTSLTLQIAFNTAPQVVVTPPPQKLLSSLFVTVIGYCCESQCKYLCFQKVLGNSERVV